LKKYSGYHQRSLAENMVFRLKQLEIVCTRVRLPDQSLRATFGWPASIPLPTSACRNLSGLGKLRLPHAPG